MKNYWHRHGAEGCKPRTSYALMYNEACVCMLEKFRVIVCMNLRLRNLWSKTPRLKNVIENETQNWGKRVLKRRTCSTHRGYKEVGIAWISDNVAWIWEIAWICDNDWNADFLVSHTQSKRSSWLLTLKKNNSIVQGYCVIEFSLIFKMKFELTKKMIPTISRV